MGQLYLSPIRSIKFVKYVYENFRIVSSTRSSKLNCQSGRKFFSWPEFKPYNTDDVQTRARGHSLRRAVGYLKEDTRALTRTGFFF